MHKPWNKHNTLEHILNNKMATIDMLLRMIDRKEVPSSVTFQFLTAMKYARQKNEILVKEGVNHPDIDKENLDKEALERLTGWIHNSHFTDNKLNDGPEGRSLYCSTSTAGRLRDGSSGQI